MNDARPYASLSSGLLARKGSAKPAMRPQGFTGGFEDLGWNDMGHGAAPDEPAEVVPVEHVPSKITALTPAPKKPALSPIDEHDEDEEGDEEEAEAGAEYATEAEADAEFEAEAEAEAEAEFEAEAEAEEEVLEGYIAPDDFAAPMDFPAADFDEIEDEVEVEIEDAQTGEPHVVAQRRAILESFDGEEESDAHPDSQAAPHRADKAEIVSLPQRAAAAEGRKAAFTLRLDGGRHLRLRLACAVTGRSAQQIVTGALDSALAGIPEIEALASRVPANSGSARSKRN